MSETIGEILTEKLTQRNDVDARFLLDLLGQHKVTIEELYRVVVRSNGNEDTNDTDAIEDSYKSLLELIQYSSYNSDEPNFEPIKPKNKNGRPEIISQSFIERSKKLSHQRRRWDRGIERSKKARRFFNHLKSNNLKRTLQSLTLVLRLHVMQSNGASST